jgi:hypothetical protein
MPEASSQLQAVHYVPIATTILSAIFFCILLARYLQKRSGPHLLWWAAGIFAYGLGTGLESAVTLWGNSVALNKAWYIAGALLGGYPLAQGTVYLLLSRRTADLLTGISLPFIIITAVLVVLSPVDYGALEVHRPGGSILEWWWIRPMTPLINGYAALFLIGGAILSAVRYSRHEGSSGRVIGNTLIAVGALLPGIGGSMAKMGIVEGLYVGEFVGVILIWIGYAYCVRTPRAARAEAPEPAAEPAS